MNYRPTFAEYCVHAMWELDAKDPAVHRMMRKNGPHIPAYRILARAVSLRMDD